MDYSEYINIEPKILGGRPHIAGTNISVDLILDQFAAGGSIDYILAQYPQLTQEQVFAAFAFASEYIYKRYHQEYAA
ncbi:MAG TPA: DUF433 domain-containing protein [Ktedonobacteraceae bacterium]|nr:DUF433 domain-containing protein [Ktedonobacteraceae bacterium]